MADFREVQAMAERQGKILDMFTTIKRSIINLSDELIETEPKTAQFLAEFAEGGFQSILMHYLLESRTNLRKAGEAITLDDILASVNKDSISKDATILALKKTPDTSEPQDVGP